MDTRLFSYEMGGQTLFFEVGKFAGQADAAVTVRYGDTVILVTAVMGEKARDGINYFPLLVDYDEKLYAAGKIKNSRFIKREGRSGDEAILTSRLIDRSIRPLFDDRLRKDVQIVVTVLSFDRRNDPDILGILGASVALSISSIPWNGPVAALRVGRINGEYIFNPSYEARLKSDFEVTLATTQNNILMVEGGANQVPETEIAEAIEFAKKHLLKLFPFFQEIVTSVGKQKIELNIETPEVAIRQATLKQKTIDSIQGRVTDAFLSGSKEEREKKIVALTEDVDGFLKVDSTVTKEERARAIGYAEDYVAECVKQRVLDRAIRVDGRGIEDVRPLAVEVGLLPRTHGSGLFQRGETQALSVVTLGTPSLEQTIDTMEETSKKRYMHHYNFPGFSTGEVAPVRGPGRREIGHGALAERALIPVLPKKEDFPYAVRVVSEILSSNGSTSMASTCGSTLALMDAGVPISAAVGGISMGFFSERDDQGRIKRYKIVSDIMGYEDFNGEMDFKVAGTRVGVTAIQADVKGVGIPFEVVPEILTRARKTRMFILDTMDAVIATPRPGLSPFAPRIITIRISVDKIRDLIGPGGKMINKIIDATGATIDIEDDGTVYISSKNEEGGLKALELVKQVTREVVVGELFEGKVTRILDFGAFVEILPRQEGMIHISELAPFRVNQVEDIVHIGDVLNVRVIAIDEQGRVNLSLKQTDFDYSSFQNLAQTRPQDGLRNEGSPVYRNNFRRNV